MSLRVQTQTRRLSRIALLASRQEAEFVSGVLDAAEVPHAIVEVDQGLELRVDPDDDERVRELIERLDVKRDAAESDRQRRGEAAGRRMLVIAVGAVLVVVGAGLATGLVGVAFVPGWLGGMALGAIGVAMLAVGVVAMKPRA